MYLSALYISVISEVSLSLTGLNYFWWWIYMNLWIIISGNNQNIRAGIYVYEYIHYTVLYIRKYTSQLIHSNLYLYSHGNKKQIILVLSSNTFKYCLYIYNFFIFHHIHTIKFISVQFQISLIQKITNLLLLFLLHVLKFLPTVYCTQKVCNN